MGVVFKTRALAVISGIFCLLSSSPWHHQARSQSIGESLNRFAINLLDTTASEVDPAMNLAMSPYTVWTLLAIIGEGARGNTVKQLNSVLGLPQDKSAFRNEFANMSNIIGTLIQGSSKGVSLNLYNGIFITADHKLYDQFAAVSRKFYGVDIRSLDFKNSARSTSIINDQVARATKGKIGELVGAGDLNDALIFLTSAMYFKADWMSPFNRSATKTAAFNDERGTKIGDVQMMYQEGPFPFSRVDDLRAYALELPYGDGRMSMVVILPYKGETVSGVLSNLVKIGFGHVMDTLKRAGEEFGDDDILVYLPRFSVHSDLSLNRVLDKMGISDVFNDQLADLTGMFYHYLVVSRFIQKAEIEVNEEGTVAAAAAGASISYKSPTPKFMADKPFIYAIVDKVTRGIVFAGRVMAPPFK